VGAIFNPRPYRGYSTNPADYESKEPEHEQ
jgi:hypothetical protein